MLIVYKIRTANGYWIERTYNPKDEEDKARVFNILNTKDDYELVTAVEENK